MEKIIKEFREKGLSDNDIAIISNKVKNDLARFCQVAQRRLFKEPFAYIFNKTNFFGNSFFIDQRVYVPNPETEEMVKIFLEIAKNNSTVVDVGCGSGAIAISIKLKMENLNTFVALLDLCPLAIHSQNPIK